MAATHTVKPVRIAGLSFALMVATAILFWPLLEADVANRALSILALAAILWMTEAIPLALTAVLVPVLAAASGVLSAQKSILPFANPVIFLFMGGFVLAGALSYYRLDRYMAQKLVSMAGGNLYRASILLMFATSLLAGWIGNTATTAMMIPLGIGLLAAAPGDASGPNHKFLILGIAYAANIGGVMTLIGTPPNAIGAAILDLSFAGWLSYSLPVFAVTFPVMVAVLTAWFRPDRKAPVDKNQAQTELRPGSNKLIAIFLITVLLWMLEGLLAPALGIAQGFTAMAALACITMIALSRTLEITQIASYIRWDVLLLFGGGLCLGTVVEQSGLGAILIDRVIAMGSLLPAVVFLWLVILFCIALTEFMSNTASAALILPLLYTLAGKMETDPALLVLPATFAASYGFMLPVGTPPNAMAYGTGLVPQRHMLGAGLVMNILFSIVLTALFYWV